jgi:hypothetical protein
VPSVAAGLRAGWENNPLIDVCFTHCDVEKPAASFRPHFVHFRPYSQSCERSTVRSSTQLQAWHPDGFQHCGGPILHSDPCHLPSQVSLSRCLKVLRGFKAPALCRPEYHRYGEYRPRDGRSPGSRLLLVDPLRSTGNGRSRPVNGEAASVACTGVMVVQFQRVNEATSGLATGCQLKADQAAMGAAQILVCTFARRAGTGCRAESLGLGVRGTRRCGARPCAGRGKDGRVTACLEGSMPCPRYSPGDELPAPHVGAGIDLCAVLDGFDAALTLLL